MNCDLRPAGGEGEKSPGTATFGWSGTFHKAIPRQSGSMGGWVHDFFSRRTIFFYNLLVSLICKLIYRMTSRYCVKRSKES